MPPITPIEFIRKITGDARQPCGNRVQIEDGNANLNAALYPLFVNIVNAILNDTQIVTDTAWTNLFTDQIIGATATANSPEHDTSQWGAVWLEIEIDSTLAPTTLRVLPQFSIDGGATWGDFEEGFFASLIWEDTATASGIRKFFLLPCGGIDLIRIRLIGTGTDANNFFTVSIAVRGFRGNFATAHA